MTADARRDFERVFRQLEKFGLLLLSDSSILSVSRLITNETIKGSWWSHEKAQTIFEVSELLEDHEDVLILKLISKKVTFVHRVLWSQIYSIGVAREDWQLEKLAPAAKLLLKTVEKQGTIETRSLGKSFGAKPGDVALELERRMLLYGRQVHTESGAHAKILESWDTWAKRVRLRRHKQNPQGARRLLEHRLAELPGHAPGKILLPWHD